MLPRLRDRLLRQPPLPRRAARRARTPVSADPHLLSYWSAHCGMTRSYRQTSNRIASRLSVEKGSFRKRGLWIIAFRGRGCNPELRQEMTASGRPVLEGPDGGQDHLGVAPVQGAVVAAAV